MPASDMAVAAPGFDSAVADIAAGDPIVNDEQSSDDELPLAKRMGANGKRSVASSSSSDQDRPVVSTYAPQTRDKWH